MVKENIKYNYLDIAKGITIILIVIGHSSIPEILSRWIWSFHLPFFFIISALFVRWDNDENAVSFIKRKTIILLAPFLIYSIINMLLFPFCNGLSHVEYLIIVLKSGWGGGALWFIPVFFISLAICKLTPDEYLTPVGLTLLTLGYSLSMFHIELPRDISTIPFTVSLMLLARRNKHYLRRLCAVGEVKDASVISFPVS